MGTPYDGVQQRNAALVFKSLQGSVFVAPFGSEPITELTDPMDQLLAMLPTGYEDVGWTSTDGHQFGRDVETSAVSAFGAVEPLRTDVTQDITTLTFAALETRRNTIGLYTGADTATMTPDETSSELQVEKPARPGVLFYRVLALAVDLTDDGEYYVARFLPRARVTDYEEQVYQSSDDAPVTWPVMMTGYEDPALGYSELYIFGGPGWAARLTDMGFNGGT